jgi:hypothetical protein
MVVKLKPNLDPGISSIFSDVFSKPNIMDFISHNLFLMTLITLLFFSSGLTWFFLFKGFFDVDKKTKNTLTRINWNNILYPTYPIYIGMFTFTLASRFLYEISLIKFLLVFSYIFIGILFMIANIAIAFSMFLLRYILNTINYNIARESGILAINIIISYLLLLPSVFLIGPVDIKFF